VPVCEFFLPQCFILVELKADPLRLLVTRRTPIPRPNGAKPRAGRWFRTIWPKTWLTRTPAALAFIFCAYGATGYVGAPALIRYMAQNQAAAALNRQVTVGAISFNPYRLRLVITDLHISGRNRSQHFIDIRRIKLRLSWTSLPHLALVAKELTVERPTIRVMRLGPSTFDFSDLIASFAGRAPNRTSLAFAVSNFEVNDGLILFDDRVLKEEHRAENIRLAIPFIADLPTDADKYVQPMLRMTVDGCPLNLTGKTKLFGSDLESVVEVGFQNLDVIPFAVYAADELPFKLKQAELSAALQFHFILAGGRPQLAAAGSAEMDNVVISDLNNSPLAELKQLQVEIAQTEALAGKLHFSSIGIDSPWAHLAVNHGGTTNLASILGGHRIRPSAPSQPRVERANGAAVSAPSPLPLAQQGGRGADGSGARENAASGLARSGPSAPLLNPMAVAPSSVPAAAPAASGGSNAYSTPNPSFSLSLDALELNNGALDITDRSGTAPVLLKLQAIHFGLKHFANVGGTRASYSFSANFDSGGHLAADGNFNPSSSTAAGNLDAANVDLPTLQGFLSPVLAATIESGKVSAHAAVRAVFGPHFNVHAERTQISFDGVELRPLEQAQSIIGWKHFSADLDRFDLASHQTVVRELRGDGLHLTALRDAHGNLNLASLLRAQPPNSQNPPAGISSFGWQYRIESLVLENADAAIEDDAQGQAFSLRISPLNIRLHGITNEFAKPFTIEADGKMTPRGTFKVAGETAINPFQGRLHINTERIDLAWLDPLITSALESRKLNAKVISARLTMNGDAEAEFRDGRFDAAYRGGVRLSNVRIMDRLTADSFLRWYALSLDGLELRYGPSQPRIQVGAMALSDFYARLILNADGRLNLHDIVTSAEQPSVPLTRPSIRPSGETAAAPPPADITVGSFTLQNGEVSYLDNFIRPNYSAVVTHLEGRVGAFGTNSTEPAEVVLAAKVNGTSPVSISGSINPLAPMASVDLQGNASRIELPPLTPYAAKYTGYPITGGTLTGTVHYKLANRQLTATNHLILDQLSFGEHVENSTAGNLPVRLAVAVLKDSQGRIDLRIPVSGSTADPQFDLGSLVWHGLVNVIMKAAESPFTVLASALGGEDQNLAYLEFAPGYSTLTAPERNKLATLAALLEQRPWLKLQISGRADSKVDRQGLREAILEDEIRQQKAADEDRKITPVPIEQVEVTPDEYNKYLWRVYKAADFDKPRNLVGIVKWFPPDQMKRTLLANIKVSDEELRHLAEARAVAVYQALSARIAPPRLLMGPPKLNTDGISEGPTTRVDFSLK